MDLHGDLKILRGVSFLNSFTDKDLLDFYNECEQVQLKENEILFEEDSDGDSMYIVLSGNLVIFREKQIITKRGAGDFFGEMALIESKMRSASVKSVANSLLLEIKKVTYEKFFATRPMVILEILKTLSNRSRTDLDILDGVFTELKESEERYRNIVETITDIVFEIDPSGIIKYCNCAITLFGHSSNEVLGHSIKEFISIKNKELPLQSILTKRVGSRATRNLEIFFKINENSEMYKNLHNASILVDAFGLWNVENNIVKRKGSQKVFKGTLFIGRDITEHQMSENMIREHRDRLQMIVDKKTEDISEAKMKAEKANSAKTEFLAKMSHELRTPMNAILGYAQLLDIDVENPLCKQHAKKVQKILKAGNHLLELMNDVLDISSIESENVEISFINVEVSTMVEHVVTLLSPTAYKYNVKIVNQVSASSKFYVFVDQKRFKQVLLNLVSNAIKYNCDDGFVYVDCYISENNKIVLTIKDTGIGIPQEKLDVIFEAFRRLQTVNSEVEGTGIGLAIVKKYTELMDGIISVESKLGSGSCFSLEFPSGCKTENHVDSNISETCTINIRSTDPKYTLLYIEDNEINTEIVLQAMKLRSNIKCLSAVNGAEGLKMVSIHKPDIILLDMYLPDIDGKKILSTLKENDKTSKIPVVVISADAMQESINNALALGALKYITKPIDLIVFLETIDNVLAEKPDAN